MGRLFGERIEGEGNAGGGGGVSFAGESCGDRSEFMSMAANGGLAVSYPVHRNVLPDTPLHRYPYAPIWEIVMRPRRDRAFAMVRRK